MMITFKTLTAAAAGIAALLPLTAPALAHETLSPHGHPHGMEASGAAGGLPVFAVCLLGALLLGFLARGAVLRSGRARRSH